MHCLLFLLVTGIFFSVRYNWNFFFNECYFVVSFLFAFKFYFFCLTNDPILLFLFGIEKEKKNLLQCFLFLQYICYFYRFCSGLDYKHNCFCISEFDSKIYAVQKITYLTLKFMQYRNYEFDSKISAVHKFDSTRF